MGSKVRPVTVRRQRLLDFLADNGPAIAQDVAAAIFCCKRNAQYLLRQMHEAGEVHISGWVKLNGEGQRGRQPIRLWSPGPGQDTPKPERDSAVVIRKRRARRLKERYGQDYMKVLNSRSNGGVSVLMRDGVLIYKRARPAGRNGGKRVSA